MRSLGTLVDPSRDGLPTDRVTVIPVLQGEQVLGSFQVVSATRRLRPTGRQLRAAVLLADQLVAAAPAG